MGGGRCRAGAKTSQLQGHHPDLSPREGTGRGRASPPSSSVPGEGGAGAASIGFWSSCWGVSTHMRTQTHMCTPRTCTHEETGALYQGRPPRSRLPYPREETPVSAAGGKARGRLWGHGGMAGARGHYSRNGICEVAGLLPPPPSPNPPSPPTTSLLPPSHPPLRLCGGTWKVGGRRCS